MATRRRGEPRVWITHVTGLMSDERKCRWAAWFKARFTYAKIKDETFDSKEYRAKHKLARDHRAEQLKADGWEIRIEDAVKFEIRGGSILLAGKPDIVAIKHDERRIRVSDPKTGQKRLMHWYQVAVYMRWIRRTLGARFAQYAVEGELAYYDVEEGVPSLVETIPITFEELTPEVLQVIVSELQTVGLELPPEKVPSELECLYCDIPLEECSQRIIEPPQVVEVDEF